MHSAPSPILVVLFAAGLAAAAAPRAHAQTTAEAAKAAAVANPPLDLTSPTTEALRAAKEAQAPVPIRPNTPRRAIETTTAADGETLAGLTVSPTNRQGVVVASTDATSMQSPNFSAGDAADGPVLAVSVAKNTAVGAQTVDNTFAGGFLKTNPDAAGDPTRTDVGVTVVY